MLQQLVGEKVVTSEPTNSADTTAPSASRAVGSVPGVLDVTVSLAKIPGDISGALEKLAKPAPASGMRTFFKEYLPAVTPLATVAISAIVFYYSYRLNERTAEFNQRAAVNTTTDALGKILDEFGQESDVKTDLLKQADERRKLIAAMKLAAYGEQALPAVKIVMGGGDSKLRTGAVRVAEEMYRAGTVEQHKLTSEIMGYYDNPAMQLGVLEWLVKMQEDLTFQDRKIAFEKLKQNFGPDSDNCPGHDEEVVTEAAKAVSFWQLPESKDLLLRIAGQCTFIGARQQAVIALGKISLRVNKDDRDLIKSRLTEIRSDAPPEMLPNIDGCLHQIAAKELEQN